MAEFSLTSLILIDLQFGSEKKVLNKSSFSGAIFCWYNQMKISSQYPGGASLFTQRTGIDVSNF